MDAADASIVAISALWNPPPLGLSDLPIVRNFLTCCHLSTTLLLTANQTLGALVHGPARRAAVKIPEKEIRKPEHRPRECELKCLTGNGSVAIWFVPSDGLVVREVGEWIVEPEQGDDGTMKGQMNVRDAVNKARETIITIFEDEDIRDPRLEEVTLKSLQGPPTWKVTISFVRPSILIPLSNERTFKVVHINDLTGEVLSVTHRTLAASN